MMHLSAPKHDSVAVVVALPDFDRNPESDGYSMISSPLLLLAMFSSRPTSDGTKAETPVVDSGRYTGGTLLPHRWLTTSLSQILLFQFLNTAVYPNPHPSC